MIYKKELLILMSIIISVSGKNFSPISYDIDITASKNVRNVRKVDPIKASKELIRNVNFNKLFRNLRRNNTLEEIRIVSTIGLLSGALQTEEAMRENLYEITDDLLVSFNKSTPKENMLKLITIEETINRDKSAVSILNGMLQYARNVTDLKALEKNMQHILRENEVSSKKLRNKKLSIVKVNDENSGQKSASSGKLMTHSGMNLKYSVKEKLNDVREMIDNHVESIHTSVTENVKQTIKYIQRMQKSNGKLMKSNEKRQIKLDPSFNSVKRLWDQMASSEENSTDFDVILNYNQYQPKLSQAFRIYDGIQMTNGEELTTAIASKSNVIVINTKLERFKRQNAHNDTDMSFMVDIDRGEPKMIARKDIEGNEDENEIEGDKSKGEKEMANQMGEDFDVSPEQTGPGGLVGLITNLSGGAEGSDVGAVLGAISQVISNLLGPGGLDVPGLVSSGTALVSSLLAGEENFGKVLGGIVGLAVEGFSGGGGAANNGQFFGQFLGKFISVLSADPDDDDAPLQPDSFIENLYDGIGKGSATPEERDGAEANPDCEPDMSDGSDSSGFIKGVVTGLFNVFAKASMGASAGLSHGSVQGLTGLSGGSSKGSSVGLSKMSDHDTKER